MSFAGETSPLATEVAPHVQFPDSAHCREDDEPWPCLVVRLAEKLTAARALAADATEYRVLLPEVGGTELRARRSISGRSAGLWAVSVPGYGGGRAWTLEGWQDTVSALSVDRLVCWPDAETAIAAARRALAVGGAS